MISCGTNEGDKKDFFCDSCESEVLQKIFEMEGISVYLPDYSDLEDIKQSVKPIKDIYINQLEVKRYLADSSISNLFDLELIRQYSRKLDSDAIIDRMKFNKFKSAFCSSKQIDSILNQKVGKSYIQFSKPLFDSKTKSVLVEVNINCNGLCGEGFTYILKNENGHWVLNKRMFRWVS